MTGPLLYLRNLLEEISRIGVMATWFRGWRRFLRFTGLDLRLSPIRTPQKGLSSSEVVEEGTRPATEGIGPFFIESLDAVRLFMCDVLTAEERDRVIRIGRKAAKGHIRAFRATWADFGHPPNWLLNPISGEEWPRRHSKLTLTREHSARFGDIKPVWEIGRFLHVPDVLRSYALRPDPELLENLFTQIFSFEEENPLNSGPHWISEQEVAIRGCMLTLLFFVLRGTNVLDETRCQVLIRQISMAAVFCEREIHFARHAIDNNHLIAGALLLFVAGSVLPVHERAAAWKDRGRSSIEGALERQWAKDGAFVQPSHNYHRLALDYLLWALRLAELQGDAQFADAIRTRLARSFRLLNAMTMASDGRLPNWGPNDGALFTPWTSCDFRDYRPLMTSLRFATRGCRQYERGPWDEQLVWLWDAQAAAAPVAPDPPVEDSFPEAGLHTLRDADCQSLMVFRCGPVWSRYGQQADQLHVDLTWRGENVLRDPGSFSYADARYHEWFRSTDAHNTVVVERKSQMVPHRQFLFLRWPNAALVELPVAPDGIRGWYAGVQDGYERLSEQVLHGRLVAKLEAGGWLVVDHLLAGRPSPDGLAVSVRWHLSPGEVALIEDGLDWRQGGRSFRLRWAGTSSLKAFLAEGEDDPVDGWISDYYGERTSVPSISVRTSLYRELVIATLLQVPEPLVSALDVTLEGVMVGPVGVPLPLNLE